LKSSRKTGRPPGGDRHGKPPDENQLLSRWSNCFKSWAPRTGFFTEIDPDDENRRLGPVRSRHGDSPEFGTISISELAAYRGRLRSPANRTAISTSGERGESRPISPRPPAAGRIVNRSAIGVMTDKVMAGSAHADRNYSHYISFSKPFRVLRRSRKTLSLTALSQMYGLPFRKAHQAAHGIREGLVALSRTFQADGT